MSPADSHRCFMMCGVTTGAAPRAYVHPPINERKDGVTLIRESNGAKVECVGVTVATDKNCNCSSTLLSLIAWAFGTQFGLANSTSFGQLIARRLAKPVVRVVKGGAVEYWELPEEHFERAHNTQTGKYGVKLKVPRDTAWSPVDVARWQELVQG